MCVSKRDGIGNFYSICHRLQIHCSLISGNLFGSWSSGLKYTGWRKENFTFWFFNFKWKIWKTPGSDEFTSTESPTYPIFHIVIKFFIWKISINNSRNAIFFFEKWFINFRIFCMLNNPSISFIFCWKTIERCKDLLLFPLKPKDLGIIFSLTLPVYQTICIVLCYSE